MPQSLLSYAQHASTARRDHWDHNTEDKPITVAEYVRVLGADSVHIQPR
jgi:hypothetical protein